MGTLASKVGENIVGKRLGMSEKDRKLLGTVFGMAGGAYGGYAGQAGFGSTGIGASGSAGGMGGQSPKVGGDYGTAMDLYSQPTVPGAGPGYYGSAPVGNVTNTGYQYMPAMGTEYTPIDGYSGVTGSADAPATFEYNDMARMDPGMDMYANNSYGNSNEMYSIGRPNNSWVNPNAPTVDPVSKGYMDPAAFLDSRPTPLYQGPSSGNISAQTFALDTPSRTIDLAPSGTPLEVTDVSAYTAPPEPFYGVDPNSPTASGSNLGMESVYNSGGNPNAELIPSTGDGYLINPDDQVRLIQENADGTFTDLSAPDLSTSQGVEEFINMDQIRADEMMGGPLDPFGGERAMARVPSNIANNGGDVPFVVDTPPLADIQSGTSATGIRGNASAKAAQERFLRSGPRLEDLDVATLNTPTARLESLDNKVFTNDAATSWSPATGTPKTTGPADRGGLGEQVAEVKSQILQDAGDGKFDLGDVLDKIPDSVKQWAAETGVALLDMWIKQELFGQDYDDQIASGGGGGGGVLRGSSPVVSPYSGGGSGGGGKGVLFSMGGGGQQGRGTHIMALQ